MGKKFESIKGDIRVRTMVFTRTDYKLRDKAKAEIYQAAGFGDITIAGSCGPIGGVEQNERRRWVREVMDKYKMSHNLRIYFYAQCHYKWTHCKFLVLPEGGLCHFGGEGLYMPREYVPMVDRWVEMLKEVDRRKRDYRWVGSPWKLV